MANLSAMQNWCLVVLNNMLTTTQVTTLLNKADLEECENRDWARLKQRSVVNSFAAITYPSVSLTQGSTTVTDLIDQFPAVTAQFVFRVSGQFYSPIPVVANPSQSSTLTLATPWPAAGGTMSGVLFQLYYSVPGWQEVTGVKYLTNLEQMTQEELDQIDPWFSEISSPALRYLPSGRDVNDNAQFILWPIETSSNPYVCHGLKGHVDMVNATDLPAIPSGVIVPKALSEACETLYVLRGDPQWSDMRDFYLMRYESEREKALEQDRKVYGTIGRIRDAHRRVVGFETIPYRDGEWE